MVKFARLRWGALIAALIATSELACDGVGVTNLPPGGTLDAGGTGGRPAVPGADAAVAIGTGGSPVGGGSGSGGSGSGGSGSGAGGSGPPSRSPGNIARRNGHK